MCVRRGGGCAIRNIAIPGCTCFSLTLVAKVNSLRQTSEIVTHSELRRVDLLSIQRDFTNRGLLWRLDAHLHRWDR